MPEAGEEEGDEQGNHLRQHDTHAAVADLFPKIPGEAAELLIGGKRVEDIVLEPARETDMPAGPELRYCAGHIRQPEILHEPDAHDAGAAHGDVGVAGEVAVNLEGEHHGGQHDDRARGGLGIGVDRHHIGRQPVGDDHFFEETRKDDLQPLAKILPVEPVGGLQLGQQILRPFNGPGHQLGKEGDEESVVAQMPLRLDAAAIDVDDIAEGLEGVKRDAHRQNEIQKPVLHRKAEQPQQPRDGSGEEVEVFIKKQNAQTGGERNDETGLFQPLVLPADHEPPRRVGHQRGEGDEEDQVGIPAHVEVIAGRQQHDPPVFCGNHKMQHRHDGKEDQVFQRVEGHVFLPPMLHRSPSAADSV